MKVNVELGILDQELLVAALSDYKFTMLKYGNKPRANAVDKLVKKLGL